MPYIPKPLDRDQVAISTLDSMVGWDSTARVIDHFVDCLDLGKHGFEKTGPNFEGRPSYDPKSLLKLYLYGYRNDVRSSRKLAKACEVNIEVMWMMGGLEPDFRTISDFRKDNIRSLRGVFQEYLRLMEETDREEEKAGVLTKKELEAKLKESGERLERYRAYRELMEKENLTQISLTDADAHLMKNKNGMDVTYNVQTAVDSETHLIMDYLATNQVTDHRLMAPTAESLKKEAGEEIIEAVADRGYGQAEDMIACMENGIIPNVILSDGKDGYELEVEYREAYMDVISDMEIVEVRRKVKDGTVEK